MIFFDTNVLVAASLASHPHHQACNERLGKLAPQKGACAAHSMAEAYSTFTGTPAPYRLSPFDALQILERASQTYTLVTLTPAEVLQTLNHLAQSRLTGGIVYDALLLACARKIGAETIYTIDYKDFRRIAPDLADRILEP